MAKLKLKELNSLTYFQRKSLGDWHLRCAHSHHLFGNGELFGIGGHIENALASITIHRHLVQYSCLRPLSWPCRATSDHSLETKPGPTFST